ncbi:FxSxx-COOH system tetratricopeptide repeat protein [Streptomyces sp. NBC_00250]|uniref:FxSxx-COOH system tetratricopeptide repeat protein n=1 Tax=Streptomyces sp. NBC_00250 TaxID=2903641 RepID=UPI002E2B3ED4|nr:FxSxx-COOH system tetratricopeptide repeat protein [Streptomyces sp. NBC_00250]
MTTNDPLTPSKATASGDRAIAAGRIGVAISGDGANVVTLPPDAIDWAMNVAAPTGLGNLPAPATGVFLGREDELLQLRRLLTGRREAAVTQTHAIHGLGGIGKSALALHYAHRYRAEYTLVWWITAESPDQISAELAALALRLCPQWAASAQLEERTAWAIQWLQWHPGWLLIFDNVEDPRDLRRYLGALPNGHHVATSRRATGWHSIAPTLPLGLLDQVAAADLLCAIALEGRAPSNEQRRQAEGLARDLGYLPLALEQAGAYLQQTGIAINVYRQKLGLLLDRAPDSVDPERTIARIWDQTLATLTIRNPFAVTVLNTLAWLAPEGISRTILSHISPDPLALDEALGMLHAYSMIAFSSPGELAIHRLVQTVLRNAALTEQGSPAGRGEAEQVVAQVLYPDGAEEAAPENHWIPHIDHVSALAASSPINHNSDLPPDFYEPVMTYLYEQGQDARAIPLREATVAQCERLLGDTHPSTLASRSNLAYAYQAAGDLHRAIKLYETTLDQRKRAMRATHPDTLVTCNNLAGAYAAAGDWRRAMPLFEATLAQREQVLGETHPDTLTSRNNLAYAYEAVGDLRHAIPLFETTLAQHEQALGDTHRQTLYSRNNLAHAYESAGDLARATALYETNLVDRERILGDMHPETLQGRNHLARAYQKAGDLARAILIFEATLAQREQVLGETHPDTLISRNNLAFAYQEVGDFTRAIPMLKATLAEREQILGENHPETLNSRNNLAFAYQGAGNIELSIPLYEATFTQREQVLGETHPDTLTSRNNLASAYSVGDPLRAASLLEMTVNQSRQILGDNHPSTLTSQHNLAHAYDSAGDFERAIPVYEATLAQREKALGESHPDTLTTRHNLAGALFAAGDLNRAVPLLELTLTQCQQVLGDSHPNTLILHHNLTQAYKAVFAARGLFVEIEPVAREE